MSKLKMSKRTLKVKSTLVSKIKLDNYTLDGLPRAQLLKNGHVFAIKRGHVQVKLAHNGTHYTVQTRHIGLGQPIGAPYRSNRVGNARTEFTNRLMNVQNL